jgi:hypothetical protein
VSDGSPGNWGFGLLLTVERPPPELIAGSGDRNRARPFTAQASPHPQEVLVYATSGRRAQAICSFNQAAVLMDLISLAVMKAAPPP